MAEFAEVMKQRRRMHKHFMKNDACRKCPISSAVNGKKEVCSDFVCKHFEEAEKIIMDWAKEHPEISNIDKLYQIVKESFGEDIAENFKEIFEERPCCATKCKNEDCKKCENHNFWRQEWKDPEEKADE